MSNQIRTIVKSRNKAIERNKEIKLRKHLNADALLEGIHHGFSKIADHRPGTVQHTLADTLMAGFAMFSLKDPSLLAFDKRRINEPHNLKTIYGMKSIPCDTSMRDILDEVMTVDIRPLFKVPFRALQRGNALEQMLFMQDCYLINLDGTGYFSSHKLYSDACLQKVNSKTGQVTYYLQAVGAALVHPDKKVVIPLCPEIIRRQDGQTKMDCERNAVRRWLEEFRREHPHLKVIINEDSLASNGPHIDDLEKYNCHYILGVKPGDHQFLFGHVDQAVQQGKAVEVAFEDENKPHIRHYFRIVYDAPLNKSRQDRRVTFVEYWEENVNTGREQHFCWITDLEVTPENVFLFMRGARARWKIENETFNTLKNQGYNFGHNYGLGKKYLSEMFVLLMMLAFLVDQVLQLCCPLFQATWKKCASKRALWERVRSKFIEFHIMTMEDLFRSILYHRQVPLPR